MAAITRVGSIKKYFTSLRDPRVRNRTEHRLLDIIAIALCGVIANCDGWTDIIDFATNRIAWCKRFLKLPHGIPSHSRPCSRMGRAMPAQTPTPGRRPQNLGKTSLRRGQAVQ